MGSKEHNENNTSLSLFDYLTDKQSVSSEISFNGDWKKTIQTVFDQIIAENRLPEKSLHLGINRGRDGIKITSYSICIYEPDYPATSSNNNDPERNSIVLNIKESKDQIDLLVPSLLFSSVEYPSEATVKNIKSENGITHVISQADSMVLYSYIKKLIERALNNYVSKNPSFGCCSKYVECSNVGYCIHENQLYSKACSYRSNLEAGRIFYGKNRNIDC